MGKKVLVITITVLLIFSISSTPAFTQTYSRMITAWFNNFQVEVDGSLVDLKNEPFIFNNEVYVPIKELSDHLFINYQLDQQARRIRLKSNRDSESLVNNYQNHFEVSNLRSQIEELQKEIQLLQNSNFPYQRITSALDMENYLKQHFKSLGNIPLTVRFRHIGGNRYNFSAFFNGNDLTRWNNLNRRDIENYVDDVFEVVRDLFNPRAEIEGDFRTSAFNSGTQYANYWTRGNRLFFDFRLAEHKKNSMVDGVSLENALNQRLRFYNSATFTYEVFVNQLDVDVIISFNQNFNTWSPSLKMQYLKRVKTEVERLYDNVNVNGRVINGVSSGNNLRFSIEGENIRSVDLLNDLEKHLNQNYKNFYYGNNTFGFTYRVTEGYSGSFEVTLVADFASNATGWATVRQNGELSFRYFVQRALQHIDSIFDVDVFGNIVDKDLAPITSIEYYRTSTYGVRTLQPLVFE